MWPLPRTDPQAWSSGSRASCSPPSAPGLLAGCLGAASQPSCVTHSPFPSPKGLYSNLPSFSHANHGHKLVTIQRHSETAAAHAAPGRRSVGLTTTCPVVSWHPTGQRESIVERRELRLVSSPTTWPLWTACLLLGRGAQSVGGSVPALRLSARAWYPRPALHIRGFVQGRWRCLRHFFQHLLQPRAGTSRKTQLSTGLEGAWRGKGEAVACAR